MANSIQTHIHLASTLGGSPEYSPVYKWSVRDRQFAIRFSVTVDESLTMVRYDHAVPDKVYKDFYYELKIEGDETYSTEEYLDILIQMVKSGRVYLVDTVHVNDNEDHTDNVRVCRIVKLGDVGVDHYALERYYLPVFLMALESE